MLEKLRRIKIHSAGVLLILVGAKEWTNPTSTCGWGTLLLMVGVLIWTLLILTTIAALWSLALLEGWLDRYLDWVESLLKRIRAARRRGIR